MPVAMPMDERFPGSPLLRHHNARYAVPVPSAGDPCRMLCLRHSACCRSSGRKRQADAPGVSQENASVTLLALDFELVEFGDGPVERCGIVEAERVVRKARHAVAAGAG